MALALSAPLCADDRSDPANVRVLAEYTSQRQAMARSVQLQREGRRVEIHKLRKPVELNRLEIGYFAERAQARAQEALLRQAGIESTFVFRAEQGYAISIGAYRNPAYLEEQRRRLAELGFANSAIVPFSTTQEVFQLVEVVAEAVPAPKEAVGERPAIEVEPLVPQAPRQRYSSRDQAERKASQLREEGRQVSVKETQLKVVQLAYYALRSEAERVVAQLLEQGIEAEVIKDDLGRGYAVTAGEFSDDAALERRYRQLQDRGYRDLRVFTYQTVLVSYVPDEPVRRRPPAEVAATPVAPGTEVDGGTVGADDAAAEEVVLVFGADADALAAFPSEISPAPRAAPTAVRIGMDKMRLELGGVTRSAAVAETSHYLHLAASANWRPSERWEYRLAGRIDGYAQTGDAELTELQLDYGESYVRYRREGSRLTLGAQSVIWGRVDELPPTDRLSVWDLNRYLLDDLQERRRAVPMVRFEGFGETYKLDALWVPQLRSAELPERDSLWSPVDQRRGRIAGIAGSPPFAALVKGGSFGEDDGGMGGYGLRLGRLGRGFDFALTLQRARHSVPYYELDEAARSVLLTTGDPAAALAAAGGDTFTARHPQTWALGADLGLEAAGATWRVEAAYLSDVPATDTELRMLTLRGLDWGAGVEFYPGDAELRVNVQLAGHHLLENADVLDREDIYAVLGSVENLFGHGRWRAKLRFSFGLDERDIYLGPELAYRGWEPHLIYLGAHYFAGAEGTVNGYYEDNSMGVLGWRVEY